jgi:hypothetical protein
MAFGEVQRSCPHGHDQIEPHVAVLASEQGQDLGFVVPKVEVRRAQGLGAELHPSWCALGQRGPHGLLLLDASGQVEVAGVCRGTTGCGS